MGNILALKSQDWLLLQDLGFFDVVEELFTKRKIDGCQIATINHPVEMGTGLAKSLQ